MHRALYFIKFLRATILNLFLAFAGVALHFVFHVRLYPLADDTIDALQAQIDQAHAAGDPLGTHFYPFVLISTGILLPAILVWIYLSITNVWRNALKVQAVFFAVSLIFFPFWMTSQLAFAVRYLDPLFTLFVVVYAALTVWVVGDICVALWKVARSTETASFRATLDPRLTLGPWSLVNKLVDLPRTPLQTWRVACAYLLAVSGALLLISATMYFISVGSVFNKLGQLTAGCTELNVQQCEAQSGVWARHILIWLPLSLLGMQGGALMQSLAKQLGGLSVGTILKERKGGYILYLRSFAVDSVVLPRPRLTLLSRLVSFRPFPVKIEEEFFDVADGYRPLIAIGAPGTNRGAAVGGMAYREYLSDAAWQEYVLEKIRKAENILIVLRNSTGVLWELAKVIEQQAVSKTLFLFDPIASNPTASAELATNTLAVLAKTGLVDREFALQGQPIGFYFRGRDVVQIENGNWSTTSYRTALSSFLSEHERCVLDSGRSARARRHRSQ